MQSDKFKEAAHELGCDEDERRLDERLKKGARHTVKTCPECKHVFQGNGWDGIDAHWRSKHAHVMSYEAAWPLIKADKYPTK